MLVSRLTQFACCFIHFITRIALQAPHRAGSWPQSYLRPVLMGMAVLVSGCLTPDFEFGDPPVPTIKASNLVTNHCENREKDADESDIDCGGLDCPACQVGSQCQKDADCEIDSCLNNQCLAPSCQDGVQSGNEVDVDCGGDCLPCSAGARCTESLDCVSEVCAAGTCKSPACDDNQLNGDESDLDCGGSCPACDIDQACFKDSDCVMPSVDDGSRVTCEEKTCRLSCPLGKGDCDFSAENGCETDLQSSLSHCGTCGAGCQPNNALAGQCLGGNCFINFDEGGCIGEFSDCDGDPQNGCEVDLSRSTQNCGTCGQGCSENQGISECLAGECSIQCNSGFNNCDGDARANGCEVNLLESALNCGGCGETFACIPETAGESPFCADGICGSTPCPEGTGDCNGDLTCSDSLDTDSNCGSCGTQCFAANGSASCQSGSQGRSCVVTECSGAFADCNQSYLDGCEVNTDQSLSRCGGCLDSDSNGGSGQNCQALLDNPSFHISAMSCSAGTCTITACETGGWADCDGDVKNGCEVDTSSDASRCGGCGILDAQAGLGNDCTTQFANSIAACTDSSCTWQACIDSNYANCDGEEETGCEVDLRSDDDHCGSCDFECEVNVSTSENICEAGLCAPSCTATIGEQCDGNVANGCEDISSDSSSCGACGLVCGATGADVDSASCSSGTCSVSCDSGLCPDLSDPENPCTATIGTSQHCLSCGDTCERSQPFCETIGCGDVNQANANKTFSSGDGSFSYSHELRLGSGTGRLIVIGVSSLRNSGNAAPLNVKYAGINVNQAVLRSTNNGGVAAVYYLSDTDLTDNNIEPGMHTVSMVHPNPQYGSFVSQTLEFGGMHPSSPIGNTGNKAGGNCSTANLEVSIASGVNEGSRYFGVLFQSGVDASSSPVVSPTSLTTFWKKGGDQVGYFTYSDPGSTSSATFNASICARYAGVAVELRSE